MCVANLSLAIIGICINLHAPIVSKHAGDINVSENNKQNASSPSRPRIKWIQRFPVAPCISPLTSRLAKIISVTMSHECYYCEPIVAWLLHNTNKQLTKNTNNWLKCSFEIVSTVPPSVDIVIVITFTCYNLTLWPCDHYILGDQVYWWSRPVYLAMVQIVDLIN